MGAGFVRAVVVLALLGAAGCQPPRPTWVKPDGRVQGSIEPPPPPPEPAPIPLEWGGGDARKPGNVHVVREGETLWRIAHDHGVDPDELADMNTISDPTRLTAGRELLLPGAKGRKVASVAPPVPQVPKKAEPASPSHPVVEEAVRTKLRWPVKGVLYAKFGAREEGHHDGIDIAAPEGTSVAAAAPGKVLYAGTQRGYGNLVILRHDDGLITLYAHNSQNLVKEGDHVDAGQRIALVGRTGRATGPHCHFEVRAGTAPRDPLRYLPP